MPHPRRRYATLKSVAVDADGSDEMRVVASACTPADTSGGPDAVMSLDASLSHALAIHMEDPEGSLAEGLRCAEIARRDADAALAARALALQGFVCVHRGDLGSGVRLALSAAAKAANTANLSAQAEVASLRAVLSLFTGAYAEAVSQAQRAIATADRDGDRGLRLFVRRMTTIVFGNLSAEAIGELLETSLALAGDDPRELALCHNDLAFRLSECGDHAGGLRELERAFTQILRAPSAQLATAVLFITRAEIKLRIGDARSALMDSQRGLALLLDQAMPNPYLLGAAIQAQVQGFIAIGEVDRAHELGESTLATLGERVPQVRGVILSTLAEGLREAGRMNEAYAMLQRSAGIEREAFRELVGLQMSLERATLETDEARRHSDMLAARNRDLADAHAELERRSRELENLQDQLRDQAERDWLTGLHNRRFLARRLEALELEALDRPVSIAILDLDDFKGVNDRYGHAMGDRVLVDVAVALTESLGEGQSVVRSGGEEFTVVLPGAGDADGARLCERIRTSLLALRWPEVPRLTISASVGVGCAPTGRDLRSVIDRADARLFEAKRTGRNRVISGGA